MYRGPSDPEIWDPRMVGLGPLIRTCSDPGIHDPAGPHVLPISPLTGLGDISMAQYPSMPSQTSSGPSEWVQKGSQMGHIGVSGTSQKGPFWTLAGNPCSGANAHCGR